MSQLKFYTYDIETYPNCFLFTGKFRGAKEHQVFEISPRMNEKDKLLAWCSYLQNVGATMVGYNSINFDYPIMHELLNNPYLFNETKASQMANQIINTQSYGQNPNHIRATDRIIPQMDLVKINHFDNANRRVSLKALQFAMRAESLEELPFEIRDLTYPEMDELKAYNLHDVLETEAFLEKCNYMVTIREELLNNGILKGDIFNWSDVKIGTEYLTAKIGRNKCFEKGSKPRQTLRPFVDFRTVVLPKIYYRTEPFTAVLDWFKSQILYAEAETRPSLEADLGGLKFYFGVGGVHASVENKVYETTETHVIKDIDVSGMYPAVAIANDFAPEHLGQDFLVAYKQMNADRKQYPKGSAMNLVLKLANNGAFGNSNNPYSCFYDPKFTYSITVNGQLQLLQLVEVLATIPGLELIQANTDGITAYVPKVYEHFFDMWCTDWEKETKLKLEHVTYQKMWIRDVNNYLSLGVDGKIKRKGAYWWPVTSDDYHGSSGSNWNKDFSNMVVQKAIEQVLINGYKSEDIVQLFTDPFDFMLRYKTPKGAKLYIGDKEMLKTVRYYVSTQGEPMKKIATPKGELGAYKRKNKLTDAFFNKILAEIPKGTWDERIHTKNKSKNEMATTSINNGFLVKECNLASKFNWNDVDYKYYIEEIEKLKIGVPK